jgi:hypothetical protein
MSEPVTRNHSKHPACDLCGEPLETAATAQNPSAMIIANSLARCSSCLVLFVIGDDLRPSEDLSVDEAAFNAAMDADPEVREWALRTVEAARIRAVTDIKAECVTTREWLAVRGAPSLEDDIAALDTYVAAFDERGRNSAIPAIRHRAIDILFQMRRQMH